MKLFRAYIITVIISISIASTVACVFIADENARKISLGEEYTVVVMKNSAQKVEEYEVNSLPMLTEVAESIEKAARFLPPPCVIRLVFQWQFAYRACSYAVFGRKLPRLQPR